MKESTVSQEQKFTLPQRAGGSSKFWILPSYAWPGGYPLTYYTEDFESLCPDCAQTDYLEWLYSLNTCEGWQHDPPVYVDVYWEGPADYCAGCNKVMEAAYGDPQEENNG